MFSKTNGQLFFFFGWDQINFRILETIVAKTQDNPPPTDRPFDFTIVFRMFSNRKFCLSVCLSLSTTSVCKAKFEFEAFKLFEIVLPIEASNFMVFKQCENMKEWQNFIFCNEQPILIGILNKMAARMPCLKNRPILSPWMCSFQQ